VKRWRILYGPEVVDAWLAETGQIVKSIGSGHELAL
jgi:hypothetical protein